MATAIKFTRNKPPHYAGERIGTDAVTADRLIKAGYAVAHDLDAEARGTVKPSEPEAPEPDGGKGGKPKTPSA